MGKTFKDQRDWERKQNGGNRRRDYDDEFMRKNRHFKLEDILLEEEDLDEYEEYDLDYYE